MAKVLECLCPCFFTAKIQESSIQLPLLRHTQKLVFPVRPEPPNPVGPTQTAPSPMLCLDPPCQQRQSASWEDWKSRQNRPSERQRPARTPTLRAPTPKHYPQLVLQESKSFRSFPKSSSVKRSVKVLRFPSIKNRSGEKFHSAAGGLIVEPCYDTNYQQVMEHILDWVGELEMQAQKPPAIEALDMDRIKRIALLEVQTKAQEFEYFMEDANTIYRNTQLKMEVDLMDFEMFEANIYATLCRFQLQCPVLTFFALFNSPQCQSRLRNFSGYKVVSKQPHLILSTSQMSNLLATRRQLLLFKFNELISEEVNSAERKLIVEIDRDISDVGASSFKRIICAHAEESKPLQVDIYTQTNMNFKPGVDIRNYFSHCHQKFAQFLIKKSRVASLK